MVEVSMARTQSIKSEKKTNKPSEEKQLADKAGKNPEPRAEPRRYYDGPQGMPPDDMDDEGNLSADSVLDDDDEEDFDLRDDDDIESLPTREQLNPDKDYGN
jgi:hypothetical protein